MKFSFDEINLKTICEIENFVPIRRQIKKKKGYEIGFFNINNYLDINDYQDENLYINKYNQFCSTKQNLM